MQRKKQKIKIINDLLVFINKFILSITIGSNVKGCFCTGKFSRNVIGLNTKIGVNRLGWNVTNKQRGYIEQT